VDVLAIRPFDLPFLGIGVLALPTGILGAGFVAELRPRKRPARTCPHCAKPLPGGPGRPAGRRLGRSEDEGHQPREGQPLPPPPLPPRLDALTPARLGRGHLHAPLCWTLSRGPAGASPTEALCAARRLSGRSVAAPPGLPRRRPSARRDVCLDAQSRPRRGKPDGGPPRGATLFWTLSRGPAGASPTEALCAARRSSGRSVAAPPGQARRRPIARRDVCLGAQSRPARGRADSGDGPCRTRRGALVPLRRACPGGRATERPERGLPRSHAPVGLVPAER